MRGENAPDGNLFSYVSLEKRVKADHPLRQIRIIVDDCLIGMDELFSGLYARVGRPGMLCHIGHAITENLNGLGDKAYDASDFVTGCRAHNITPHVARHSQRRNIDGRTTRHASYAISQKKCKIIEELFGWSKTVGTLAKTMFRGTERVAASFKFNLSAYNLVRLPKLLANTP
jgi:hypothetical protein